MRAVYNYEDAVINGLALLDEKYPGWAHLIDVDTLNMEDSVSCVLGQLHGDYIAGLYCLGIKLGCGEHYGFTTFNNEEYDEEAYDVLGGLWVSEIVDRTDA